MGKSNKFELTYGSMFNPPEELHTNYEKALTKVKQSFGKEYGMFINGKDRFSDEKFEKYSPVNQDLNLGVFQKGTKKDAEDAMEAAQEAFLSWSRMKWQERLQIIRRGCDLIDERLFEISAAMSLEVGKTRLEAMGDVAESAALVRYACDQMEANNGFYNVMGKDPIDGYDFTNVSVLRPFGVWVVISPFNFPGALSLGPVGAALAAGNTVVLKPASDTSLSPRLLVDCFRDGGLPDGVLNFVTGSGRVAGQTLVDHPLTAGITFTGSYDVGMGIYRSFANGAYVRPIILELGGKNPVIVSEKANLEDAAQGILRSAFGLQGQKCSANSRIFVQEALYEPLLNRLVELTGKLKVGDPTERDTSMGPVINQNAYEDYQKFVKDLSENGEIVSGGGVITDGDMAKGYFCKPTLVADLPLDHKLWQHEMFLPITTIAPIKTLDEGMKLANSVMYGLTGGFYGSEEETDWFFDQIEAGVVYANRPQGSTTGAWPGYQPFGGWKGSGSSGKNGGGLYYVQLYMHEQSRTLVRKK